LSTAHAAHTIPEYLEQAAHNSAFAQFIRQNKSECLDWSATCLFYAAVHYINAYLVKTGRAIPRRHTGYDPKKRPGRTNIVQQDPQLSAIYPEYRHLDDESRDARYELKKVSASDYDRFLFPKLEKIRAYIAPKVTQ
jgi:hypothetical protein